MPVRDIFNLIRSKGTRVSSPAFSVFYKSVSPRVNPRIVVSQKIDKRATVRNRLRRQIREILRGHSPHLGVMVITKKPILEMDFSQIQRELTRLIK